MKQLLPFIIALLSAPASAQLSAFINHTDAYCGLNNGLATVFHASLPGDTYAYQWSNGATTQSIQGLSPGDYTVAVIDQEGVSQEVGVTILMTVQQPIQAAWLVACEPGSCDGRVFVQAATELTAQPMSYTVDPPQCAPGVPDSDTWGFEPGVFIGNLAGGTTYTITVTDANGCSGTITNTIDTLGPASSAGWPLWTNVADGIVPACGTAANGSFRLVPQDDWASWMLVGPNGVETFYGMQAPYIFSGLVAGTYSVHRYTWNEFNNYYGYCEAIEVVIPALAEPCTGVTGQVTHDADEDCTMNASDFALPYRVLTIEPGPHYAFAGADGSYWKDLPEGSYTIQQSLTDEDQTCPPVEQVPFTVDGTTPLPTVDFFNRSTVPHDISVWMQCGTPVVGFATQVTLFVHNNSAFPSGDVVLDLAYDAALLDPMFSAPLNLGVIAPYGMVTVVFTANVPADVDLLDEAFLYTATVTNTTTEPNTANNTMTVEVEVVGSYDPNDKQGLSSGGGPSQYILNEDAWLDYTVRFQNTGTAPAQTVVIRDTIDADLAIASIQILGASHAFTPSIGDERELVITFNNIDLPDSTADLLGSQGFISYRIKPNSDIAVGDLIENTAAIHFDLNPAIITNTVTHSVEVNTGTAERMIPALRLFPNPASDQLTLITTAALTGVEVVAADGRTVHVPVKATMNGVQLDVHGLQAGLYTVRTSTGNARFVKH